jgi:hypothetical protein
MTNVLHVYPLNDLIEHDRSDEDGSACPCGPETRPVERENGSIGWLIIHPSLDGREKQERGESP